MRELEKKAKQYADYLFEGEFETPVLLFKKADIRVAYMQGFEDATKWHYPSKGEYPKEGESVLVAFQEGGFWYFANAEYHEGGWASVVDLGNIVAWQYIEPPKEEA